MTTNQITSMRNVLCVAVLSCSALGAPAHAQDMNALRGHEVLHDFAKCSVKYEHDLSKQVALGRSPAPLSDEEIRRALDPRCLGMWGVSFRFTGLALRGALAEELVRRDFGQWPHLNFATLPRLSWPIPMNVRAGPGAERLNRAALQKLLAIYARDARAGRLGECVMRASPEGAVAVFNTEMDSKAEDAALKALAPQVAACVKAGATSDFNGTSLRYAMATSYYRLANAASVPAPAAARSSDDLAIQAAHNFGSCIVRESPTGAVEQVLDMDFRTEDYRNKLRAMAKGHDRCILGGWQLGSSQVLIAGAMAEALLKSKLKPGEMPRRLGYDPARQIIQARSPTETMALCTVLKAPEPTARLLETDPTTQAEAEAIKAVTPVLGECLTKDMKVALNPPAVRSLLALAAWRIAATPKAAAQ